MARSAYKLSTPLKALLYYLCVKGALEAGTLQVPSTHDLSDQLGSADKSADERVKELWTDLAWMNEQRLLFKEKQYDKKEYFRHLTQPSVNSQIQKFRPGIAQIGDGHRYEIVPAEFVEKITTAIRLVTLKDLFRFTNGDLPQKLVFDFMANHARIIDDDRQLFDSFIQKMKYIGYISLDKPNPEFSDSDDRVMLEPGPVFRCQDMYIELRALDYLSERGLKRGASQVRQARRLELHKNVARFRVDPTVVL